MRRGFKLKDNTLFMERDQLFNNAIQMKKNKRAPLYANFFTWKILDSKYKLSQAMNDYDIMEEVVSKFHERYLFDAYADRGTRNPVRLTDALGVGYHKICYAIESVSVVDHFIMESNEYKEIVENPEKFYWSKAVARYCPGLT